MKKMKALAGGWGRAPPVALGEAPPARPGTPERPPDLPNSWAFLSRLVAPSRTALLEGRAELQTGRERRARYLFLFDDLLVVAKLTCKNKWKLKRKTKLSDVWLASCVKEVGGGDTDATRSFVLGWPTVNVLATFSSPDEKDKWLSLLQRHISLEKERGHPKTIPLTIFTKDVGDRVCSRTLRVRNSDTANDVIHMSLAMLGIGGSEREYQLWVNSGKAKGPCPLIGHECPYGIQMSHLRDAALQARGSEDSPSPLGLQELCLAEQLPREMRCQFALKPRRPAAAPELRDSGEKTFRRGRALLQRLCGRGSSPAPGDAPRSPAPPVPRQLFGVSLTTLCKHDNLPQPVWEMLFCLHENGPLTPGIFRLSAGMKSCRELKEQLNSGAEVHLDSESAVAVTSVFKDFLRNIPGSVLASDLYDGWVCVMEQENDEERINSVRSLLDQLPRANVVLLRYLFGVLHDIAQQSSFNQMTAYNLAVCVAPSMLWPPPSCSLELEKEWIKTNTLLVQFLIENSCRIFGEDITSLFGEASGRPDAGEGASAPSVVPKTATRDSWASELSEDRDASCSDPGENLGQGSGRMGSALTLADDDLGQPQVEDRFTLSDFEWDLPPQEDTQKQRPLESPPVAISVASCSHMPPRDLPKNQPSEADTCGHPPPHTSQALQSSRRRRCCSEPDTDDQSCALSCVPKMFAKKEKKASCRASHLRGEEDGVANVKEDTLECQFQAPSETPQPSTWWRKGWARLKGWSCRKNGRAFPSEKKERASLENAMEPPLYVSSVPEANSLQASGSSLPPSGGKQETDMCLRAMEELGAQQESRAQDLECSGGQQDAWSQDTVDVEAQQEAQSQETEDIKAQLAAQSQETRDFEVRQMAQSQETVDVGAQQGAWSQETLDVEVQQEARSQDTEYAGTQLAVRSQETDDVEVQPEARSQESIDVRAQQEALSQETNDIRAQQEALTQETNDVEAQQEARSQETVDVRAQKEAPSQDTEDVGAQQEAQSLETDSIEAQLTT